MESTIKPEYQKFTVRMAVQLAAPHTWPAAILPALVATSAAAATGHAISPIMACVLLAICILMQASVNTFNDYYDFVKGADSADDDVEVSDATLVYNNVNPACALRLGIGFWWRRFFWAPTLFGRPAGFLWRLALWAPCLWWRIPRAKRPFPTCPLAKP